MLPFASPCLPYNIIPISEASNKNPKFKIFFNKYFVCFLAHFSTTSYVGNKVQPIIQSSFHQGSNILTQKFKIQKTKTTTTPRYRLYYTVVTNQGDLYPNLQQISGKVNQLVSKFYTGTSKLTLPRVTTDAVKWRPWRQYLIKDGLRRRVTARNQS